MQIPGSILKKVTLGAGSLALTAGAVSGSAAEPAQQLAAGDKPKPAPTAAPTPTPKPKPPVRAYRHCPLCGMG